MPSPGQVIGWPGKANKSAKKAGPDYQKKIDEISDRLQEAQAWSQLSTAQRPVRPDLEALASSPKLFIHAQRSYQIEDALKLCRRLGKKWVLVGGAEALEVAAELRQDGVDVIYTEVYRLPERDWQEPDHFYRQPALLSRAGLRVALAGPSSRDNARWLTEMAAASWAHGWTEQEAEDSITRIPCEILGLTGQGRIAPGQRATLIACDGPLLDGRTRVLRAWVGGREIDLMDRQKRLYERYRNRPRTTLQNLEHLGQLWKGLWPRCES